MLAPTLTTARLTLRMPVLADFEPHAAFFASEVGLWPLRGYGPFSVDMDGAYVGEVGIYHAADYPEPELGWFVVPEAEGKAVANEAARAVMVWMRATFGWDHTVNYIHPNNARSIALGLRLGGRISDRPGIDPDDVVIEHDLRDLA